MKVADALCQCLERLNGSQDPKLQVLWGGTYLGPGVSSQAKHAFPEESVGAN